jgi:hypothetical protein
MHEDYGPRAGYVPTTTAGDTGGGTPLQTDGVHAVLPGVLCSEFHS